jgi:hypothetical protein
MSGEYVGCSSVVTSFFAKNSPTKTDLCAGALREKEGQLFDLHFRVVSFRPHPKGDE